MTTTTFICRDDNHYAWTYTVRPDGHWRRPQGGWKTPEQAGEMGPTFSRHHAEAVALLRAVAGRESLTTKSESRQHIDDGPA